MAGAAHVVKGCAALTIALICCGIAPASAQTIPFADTEDATLSEISVGPGRVHPVVSVDVRNGDYARGAFDDDDAGLGRVPLHVSIGGAIALNAPRGDVGALFLIGQSSNGVHSPGRDERAAPRAWYESNNLLGLAWQPLAGLTTAATYAIKTSPNGIAATTHEASLTVLYTGEGVVGALKPRFAVTRRAKGQGGFYTIAGVSPQWTLTADEDGPTLSLPITAGMGWRGFYAADSGSRAYGSAGLSLAVPVRAGGATSSIEAQLLALVRDDRLRRLDAPGGTTATIVPYATVSFNMAW